MVKAIDVDNGLTYALKIVKKSKIEKKAIDKTLMMNELNIMKEISHNNIIEVRSLLHDNNNYYIAAEYCKGGELLNRLCEQKSNRFHEKDAGYIIN